MDKLASLYGKSLTITPLETADATAWCNNWGFEGIRGRGKSSGSSFLFGILCLTKSACKPQPISYSAHGGDL